MAGVRIQADFSDVQNKLGIAAENLRKALLIGIKDSIFLMARQTFDRQRSPEGRGWAPLSPAYARRKARLFPSKGILQARGGLLRTLFGEVQGVQAIVGSPLSIYPAAHQYGTSRMPARPFLPTPETAEKEAARVADEILQDALDQTGLA